MDISSDKLLSLIASGESETLEFKESFGDEALETIGAFSNARGGLLLIGVNDFGGICGFNSGKNNFEEIANRIQNVTDPRLQPSISMLQFNHKNIITIQVLARSGAPVSVRGRYFRRLGRTNQRMSHEEIMQGMILNNGISWDAFLEPTATLKDLDPDRINRSIAAIKETGRRPISEQVNGYEFLRKIRLIQDEVPTRAALLLFGREPEHYFSSAFLKLGRFRSPIHIVDDREVHGTLIDQMDDAMAWFRERLITEFNFSGKPQRDVRWEYPLNSIREAVINLIVHRDYTSAAHSQIRLYDDHLEFWNSGNLPPPLTPEILLGEHDSLPRNRKIAEVFFYMGLIERWGSGTTRMATELLSVGLPKPKFESGSGRFGVIFSKQLAKNQLLEKYDLSN
ncbi:MAG: ATP-binding protein, partial [Rhabdochlamydiaceae bacterium]